MIKNSDRLKIIDALLEISKQPGEYFLQDHVLKSALIARESGIAIFKELVKANCLTIIEDCHFKKYNFTEDNYNSKEFKTYFYNALQLGGLRGALLKQIRIKPNITTKQLAKKVKQRVNTTLINLKALTQDKLIYPKKKYYTPTFCAYYWYPTKEYITLLEELK